jgi:ABC-type transport system involved in multi-copper enzyme maturation permease subunit
MVLLPVVERELRIAARGPALYRVRFWAVLALAGVFAWGMESHPKFLSLQELGQDILAYLTDCAFAFSALIGVIATSDSVSREKREGTLGLLFLTDLKGYDVVCGKLAANSISALYALVATLPVLGIPLLLGGVTFLEFAKLALVLFTTMILSLAVGVFVSAFSRDERKAMMFTFLLMAGMVVLPILLTVWILIDNRGVATQAAWMAMMFSPGYGIIQTMAEASAASTGWPSASSWFCVAWQWLVALALILVACAQVPKSWQDTGAEERPRSPLRTTKASPDTRGQEGRKWLEQNPFLWLALQGEEASRGRVWVFVGPLLVFWAIAVLNFGLDTMADEASVGTWMLLMNTPLKIWIAAEACRRFSEDRAGNAFELLLSTPLDGRQIIRGQWLALRAQFAAPLVVVLAWEAFMAIHHFMAIHPRLPGIAFAYVPFRSNLPTVFLMAADSAALASVGMWAGLKFKGRVRAMLATLAVVMGVPQLLNLTLSVAIDAWHDPWNFSSLFRPLVYDPLLVLLSLSSLRKNFREFASRK